MKFEEFKKSVRTRAPYSNKSEMEQFRELHERKYRTEMDALYMELGVGEAKKASDQEAYWDADLEDYFGFALPERYRTDQQKRWTPSI